MHATECQFKCLKRNCECIRCCFLIYLRYHLETKVNKEKWQIYFQFPALIRYVCTFRRYIFGVSKLRHKSTAFITHSHTQCAINFYLLIESHHDHMSGGSLTQYTHIFFVYTTITVISNDWKLKNTNAIE